MGFGRVSRHRLFDVADDRYGRWTAKVAGRGWRRRSLIAFVVALAAALFWYLLLGYVHFELWEQPASPSVVDHVILDLLGIDGLEASYFKPAYMGLLAADAMGTAGPALIGVFFALAFMGRRGRISRYPFAWVLIGTGISVLIALAPTLIAFASSNLYHRHGPTYLSEMLMSTENDGVYFEPLSAFALSALTPLFLWLFSFAFEAGHRWAAWGLRGASQVRRSIFGLSAERAEQAKIINRAMRDAREGATVEGEAENEGEGEGKRNPGRWSLFRAALARFFGFDFFISYTRRGGYEYAHALLAKLTAGGYRCFIDESEMHPGEAWRRAVFKALSRSSVLLVVANRQALERDSVFHEVRAFSSMNRPIMPVIFDQSLPELDREHRLWSFLEQRLWCEESGGLGALEAGEPTAQVIETCDLAFSGVRIQRIRQWILGGVASTFAILALVATIQSYRQLLASRELNTQLIASSSLNELDRNPSLALLLARTANSPSAPRSPTTVQALVEATSRWPDLRCLQRIGSNRFLANSPWLEAPFVAVETSYGTSMPSLCEPQKFKSEEHRDTDFRTIAPISGDFEPSGQRFLLGNRKGAVYSLSRDTGEVSFLRQLAAHPISPIVSVTSRPGFFLYATEPDAGSRVEVELCLVDSKSWSRSCGLSSLLEYRVDHMAYAPRLDAVFVLSQWRLWRAELPPATDAPWMDWVEIDTGFTSPSDFALDDEAKTLAVSDGEQIRTLDLESGLELSLVQGPGTYISALALSGNGEELAIGLDEEAENRRHRVLRVESRSGELLAELPGMDATPAAHIDFADDDHQLVVVSQDGLVSVWNLENEPPATINLPARLLKATPRFGGGFDLLLDTDSLGDGRDSAADRHIRLAPLPKESSGQILDFASSSTEDLRLLSRGLEVYFASSGQEWQQLELPGEPFSENPEDGTISRLSPHGGEAWLFRSDLTMARWDLRSAGLAQDWEDSPRTTHSWVGGRALSEADYLERSVVTGIAPPKSSSTRLLALSDGSLVRSRRTLAQTLRLVPPHRSLSFGIANLGNSEVFLSTSESGGLLAAAESGWMNTDRLVVFDLRAESNTADDENLDAKPRGLALSKGGEMLALLTQARESPATVPDAVRLRILDPRSLSRLRPDIPVPGRNAEHCRPQLAWDAVSEQLLLSRCGLDYSLLSFSIDEMQRGLQEKVPMRFYPGEATLYGVDWHPLPDRP